MNGRASSGAVDQIAFARERLGVSFGVGARILDFGCGDGRSVAELLSLGYDAWGTDIHIPTSVPPEVHDRLRPAQQEPFCLPFDRDTFDFVFSDQVMEHVEDPVAVFRELVRVMKPGALSTHRFPGPLCPFDGHVHMPLPVLCRNRLWIGLWTLLRVRPQHQGSLSFAQSMIDSLNIMRHVNYRSKNALRACAREAGAGIEFVEADELIWRGGGRLSVLYSRTGRMGAPLLRSLSIFAQRYMVLRNTVSDQ